jgi:hypothetical protein
MTVSIRERERERERAIIMPSPLNLRIKTRKFNATFWHEGIATPSGVETDQN